MTLTRSGAPAADTTASVEFVRVWATNSTLGLLLGQAAAGVTAGAGALPAPPRGGRTLRTMSPSAPTMRAVPLPMAVHPSSSRKGTFAPAGRRTRPAIVLVHPTTDVAVIDVPLSVWIRAVREAAQSGFRRRAGLRSPARGLIAPRTGGSMSVTVCGPRRGVAENPLSGDPHEHGSSAWRPPRAASPSLAIAIQSFRRGRCEVLVARRACRRRVAIAVQWRETLLVLGCHPTLLMRPAQIRRQQSGELRCHGGNLTADSACMMCLVVSYAKQGPVET